MVFVSNHIKSNDTGQDPDGRTDEDVPWKVYAADDAHAKAHVHDHFQRLHPDTNWRSCLEHGEKIGIGTRDYELVKI